MLLVGNQDYFEQETLPSFLSPLPFPACFGSAKSNPASFPTLLKSSSLVRKSCLLSRGSWEKNLQAQRKAIKGFSQRPNKMGVMRTILTERGSNSQQREKEI